MEILRWRGLSRCLEVGKNRQGWKLLGVKGRYSGRYIFVKFDWLFWEQGEDFARFCGACPQHDPGAQIWVTSVERKLVVWKDFYHNLTSTGMVGSPPFYSGWFKPMEWCAVIQRHGLHGVGNPILNKTAKYWVNLWSLMDFPWEWVGTLKMAKRTTRCVWGKCGIPKGCWICASSRKKWVIADRWSKSKASMWYLRVCAVSDVWWSYDKLL